MTRLVAALAAVVAFPAAAADMTPDDLRALLAMAGLNRGTSRAIGDLGVQTVTSVTVERGARRGDFVVRVHIEGRPAKTAQGASR